MGAKEAKLKENFLFAIVANREGECVNFLKKYPDYVNTQLVENTTNPICRAAYLGHQNIVTLLLKYGADINLKSSDGRTPLMWAAFRNNAKLCEYLLDNGSDITLEDNQGWNALDLAIIKMNYDTALVMKRRGLNPRPQEYYEAHVWQKYDIELFFKYLEQDVEQVDYNRFFDLIKKQQEEWLNKDLVVDTRETWKKWFNRQLNFEDPPLIPREELPEQNQPHRSFYGKLSCFMNGYDPYPQKKKNDLQNPLDQSETPFSSKQPLRQQSNNLQVQPQQEFASINRGQHGYDDDDSNSENIQQQQYNKKSSNMEQLEIEPQSKDSNV